LSEIRDYFRGTVEKSFGVNELKGLLTGAGLEVVSMKRHVCTASGWKMAEFNPVHRFCASFMSRFRGACCGYSATLRRLRRNLLQAHLLPRN